MKLIPNALAALLCSSALLLSAVSQAAEEINRHNFKIAFVQAKDHPHGLGAQKFAELIKEKSDGKMKVMVFASGTLGGDAQVISSVQGGTVDMTLVTPGLLSGIEKGFALYGLPFLFQNSAEVDAVLDGPAGQNLLTTLEPHGLIGLGYWDHGFRHITNSKHPVQKLEDIKGLKLRLQQIPTAIESFKALGANVVPLSFTELYTAMETRTVDGQENPLAAIETSKFYEVQKYLSLTGHFYDPLVAIFSKRTWDKLNETERELVRSASLEAQAYERKVSRDMDVSSREALAKHGMQINEVAPEEIERMREQVRPTVEKLVAEYGPALMDEMNAEIAKVRNAQ
ncbi:TRAP transporter substrate-binding protein [Ectopseudomonas composti]|jgi:tripartite ATP-independent transporter DctP family solute receptor|uniref:ABC transporter substrate-binding protein n=1 Tax=Ectopseudomonas composti TaxID=658457 RepID=A0A1I5MU90_9GAMM|nr:MULTISPECIES: TRAP transporter substrate-binding protein [Pseudomonas]EZH80057.1 ABC transporter substrate-binding protein [Pseudomonas composti]MDN5513615.1 TRAP transporter substrate-binding protein [Pseudomonas sp.]QNH06505.1 TRAP transporter substrate-binding protein [Pseudomonas sp. B11D7D]SFP12596.1 tripartite ATP-independent transporter solute receptor, DctP family [Pseudomonas composti]